MIGAICILLFLLTDRSPECTANFDAAKGVIRIYGLQEKKPEAIATKVAVYYGEKIDPGQPKVIGSFTSEEDVVIFKPKYGFTAGSSFTLCISRGHRSFLSLRGARVETRLIVRVPEATQTPSTVVTAVYPSTNRIPMNQLKFYLCFSGPMRQGQAFDHIRLVRLPDRYHETEAFLASTDELWDPARKRLTLFFDPGRIKRGVQPNLQLGLPLVEGRNYQLSIDRAWLDHNDVELLSGFEKDFTVVGVDRKSPDPARWLIDSPAVNSCSALTIDFREPMDYGLLYSTIKVVAPGGEEVSGNIELKNNETIWSFTPDQAWIEGGHRIVVNTWLEDLAGNNIRRKFDVDLSSFEDQPSDLDYISIPFAAGKPN